jgi:hypothetical protein
MAPKFILAVDDIWDPRVILFFFVGIDSSTINRLPPGRGVAGALAGLLERCRGAVPGREARNCHGRSREPRWMRAPPGKAACHIGDQSRAAPWPGRAAKEVCREATREGYWGSCRGAPPRNRRGGALGRSAAAKFHRWGGPSDREEACRRRR